VHAEGAAITQATQDHRTHKAADARESKRLAVLAGALGMQAQEGETITERAIEARQRRLARLETTKEGET